MICTNKGRIVYKRKKHYADWKGVGRMAFGAAVAEGDPLVDWWPDKKTDELINRTIILGLRALMGYRFTNDPLKGVINWVEKEVLQEQSGLLQLLHFMWKVIDFVNFKWVRDEVKKVLDDHNFKEQWRAMFGMIFYQQKRRKRRDGR